MLNYRETERQRSVRIRESLCEEDPGGGIYQKLPRDFVLIDPEKNLWTDIRKYTIDYFQKNKIVWWPGQSSPTGHLLSSQISCLNHWQNLTHNASVPLYHWRR